MMGLWSKLGPVGIEKKRKGQIKILSSALLVKKYVSKLVRQEEGVAVKKKSLVGKARFRQL